MDIKSILRKHEGLRLRAYPDPASGGRPYTIGYGHTKGVKLGDECTLEQAEQWLTEDLAYAYKVVDREVKVPLTNGQRDALASFVFNVGTGRKGVKDGFVTLKVGRPSTMLTKLNQGDFKATADEFLKWNKGSGKVMAGLTNRRKEERALFLTSVTVKKQEKEVAPFLVAAIPSLMASLPEFAKIFSKPDVAARNVEAVTKASEIIMQASGSSNIQEASERVQADPQTASEVNDALRSSRADLLDILERFAKIDEDSIASAREFNRREKPLFGQWQFVHVLSLFLASLGGFAALLVLTLSEDPTERVMALQTLLIVGFASVASFWLGSSRSSQVKDIIQDK